MSFADAGDEPQYDEDDFVVIEAKTKEHKKEITSGLRRVDRLVQETNQQAANTNVEIKRQGEVIKGIEEKVDHTNESLNYADHLVKSIDSFWYALNPFKKKKKKGTTDPSKRASTDLTEAQEATSQAQSTASRLHRASNSKPQRLTSDQVQEQETITGFSAEDQQSLNSIQHGLSTLKEQMLITGDQLEKQNKDLERLNPKVQQVTARMEKTTGKIKTMC
eukprot:TRINITY_DN2633_c0_g1_i2.p1 TRINITY_DN2633_c0_g1~~TRINITY_DN2633_c0_g1_i2.p1  ORF type:complete len:237 (+),score=78.24 TRINITY_DN2633_c0_g1_i2:52-711(+)